MLNPVPFFHDFVENIHQVFFVYDPATNQVTFVNAAYERLLGGNRARVNEELPQLIDRLHPDDRPYLANCWRRWQRGRLEEKEIEFRLLAPDGTEQWLQLKPHHQQTGTEQHLLGGFLDVITGQKEYMANVDKFNAKKNATLEILSHDLAGPFIMLQQLAEYMGEQVGSLRNENLNEMIRIMQTTCKESVDLIRDFVDQEFLDSANVELKLERVDMVERMQQMMESYKQSESVVAKNFTLIAPQEPVYVNLDVNKFMQVLNNLVSNALKFTPDGGHITLTIAQEPSTVRFTVADDGIGIPQAQQAGLFDRFTKARRPGLRGEKTTGLGMSIIKTIVGLHRGRIWFESEEGKGSTFYIDLPLNMASQSNGQQA
ncbi:PAS domain-containing sensor histidine kinase [Hymenobacter sp. HDW8]|uniref:PAS domain-containing sensor histidine kinase n=1 Tax=Hymenobacter sp. HDW8 TaxID=2714932 RepID=UPI00140E8AA5|nr:PAS domain-containing sensor histidine kinase [Hymenobacter sp. HDW8]QIL76325.1 PAS domain-containing protein [Hymenobacter sp. HDW8]